MFGLFLPPLFFPLPHFPSFRGEGLCISHQYCLQSNTCPQLLGPRNCRHLLGWWWMAGCGPTLCWIWTMVATVRMVSWNQHFLSCDPGSFVLGNGPVLNGHEPSLSLCVNQSQENWAQSSSHEEKISDWNKKEKCVQSNLLCGKRAGCRREHLGLKLTSTTYQLPWFFAKARDFSVSFYQLG